MKVRELEEKHPSEGPACDSSQWHSKMVADAFLEIFELLEEYAPAWYTEEHHNRALSALRALKKP